MARRKTADPRRIAILDKMAKARADCERNYRRMKRAFTRMEKARLTLARLQRRLDQLDARTPRPAARSTKTSSNITNEGGPNVNTTAKTTTRPSVATAADLAALMASEGFRAGTPPPWRAETVTIDRGLCRRARCPACKRRGLSYQPMTDGRTYRILAACPRCRTAEEM